MKKIIPIIFIVFCLSIQGFSQFYKGQYYVGFDNKSTTPYSLSHPEDFLSQRSIDRRLSQGISLNASDLPVDPDYVMALDTLNGVDVMTTLKWLNGAVIYLSDSTQAPKIVAFPFVNQWKYLSPIEPTFGSVAARKMDWEQTWPSAQSMYKEQSALMNLDFLHELGYQGSDMIIAVIDAGFIAADTMRAFDHLRNTGRIIGAKDFVDPGTSAYKASTHGTYVLSIMGGLLDGRYIGAAPDASYLLLRSENASTEFLVEEYLWMAAAEYADSVGADIINSSLGYTDFDSTNQNHTYQELDGNTAIATIAADQAASKGILVVVSAGNSGNSPWFYIGSPADADSVLAVGAVNSKGEYASFSSKGPRTDGYVKPDVASVGWKTEFIDLNGNVLMGNGTSFASPMMAGAAACLWQFKPEASAMEIRDAVIRSANQYFNPDSLIGYGIPDMIVALQDLNGTNIPSLEETETLYVFPNPFETRIVVLYSAKQSGTMSVTLQDRMGRIVYSSEDFNYHEGINSFQLKAVDHLASGIYILCLRTEENVFCRRILK